jgi:hypothetical protein
MSWLLLLWLVLTRKKGELQMADGWLGRLLGSGRNTDNEKSPAPEQVGAEKLLDDTVRRLFKDAGLSKYADGILALKKYSICFRTKPQDEEPGIGASKIGGTPDFPPEFEWPRWLPDTTDDQRYEKEWEEMNKMRSEYGVEPSARPTGLPLSFIAQINLADTKEHDFDKLLPTSGMLYFFLETGQ